MGVFGWELGTAGSIGSIRIPVFSPSTNLMRKILSASAVMWSGPYSSIKKNRLWVGTGASVDIYEPDQNRFRHFILGDKDSKLHNAG